MEKYYFDKDKNFVIKDYDKAKTFSSFLPGVAGLKGIPMWSFYVNRGQGVCSFGIQDKHNPIMEFSPANIAYQTISTNGFRSFVKIDNDIYEPFQSLPSKDKLDRKMYIKESEFSIEEINYTKGIQYKVTYFGLPNESYAALVRKVDIKNISNVEREIEVIDGLPAILPYGIKNEDYKAVGNLLRSWMEVYNLENNIPFYKVRATTGDEAEVSEVTKGHFYLSFSEEGKLLQPIVDANTIFGLNVSLSYPDNFLENSIEALLDMDQVTANKVPSGFSAMKKVVQPDDTLKIRTMIGHVEDIEIINQKLDTVLSYEYFDKKQGEAYDVIRELTNQVETKTANPIFDEYIRQNHLDNLLRGGYPILLDNGKDGFVYHVYSRKHGDLERDYNFFTIAPEYYSQGNGNFRDANQNRRNDILLNPKVGSYNVKTFMSLIQIDGYNPLSVKGSTFEIIDKTRINNLVESLFDTHKVEWNQLLSERFTPGKIINFIHNQGVKTKLDEGAILKAILSEAKQNIEAAFGEGFWSDHWTYNMDLVDAYLNIYPDNQHDFLFTDKSYTFFDSPVYVLPRNEKYVLTKDNRVRQYGSVIEDEDKMKRFNLDINETNWLRIENGSGKIYETSLFAKLVSLALNKFVSLDSEGMGIEMEANKPGWNDAMNGLPGIFGSGLSETFELKRVLEFISEICFKYPDEGIQLPEEVNQLLLAVDNILGLNLKDEMSNYDYWNQVSSLKEDYREAVRYGISGEERDINLKALGLVIDGFMGKIDKGIATAKEMGCGIYPTFFYYEATDYEVITDDEGNPVISHYGLPKVKVNGFICNLLPYFLEGPARGLKTIKDMDEARDMYKKVKESNVYDRDLKMYKTSESLDDFSNEIGRIRAFTAGWLERESIFLHMTYKYNYATLKAGLYDEFYEDIKTNMVAFLEPETYGRSILENSSFIASSVNPNPSLHGQGFVARLSGSTAEALSMWFHMMVGSKAFRYEDNELTLAFKPVLPEWLFDENNEVAFTFLGQTRVCYRNDDRRNTFGNDGVKVGEIELIYDNESCIIKGNKLVGEQAESVRNGLVKGINIKLQ